MNDLSTNDGVKVVKTTENNQKHVKASRPSKE